MLFWVYVLESESSGRLYVGHTNDLRRCLDEHASGQARSTRRRGPSRLVGQRAFPSRAEAMRCERALKALKRPARIREALSSW